MTMRVLETDSPVGDPDVGLHIGTGADVVGRDLPREEQSTWTWPVDPTEDLTGPPDESAHDSLAGTLLMALAWANQNF